MLIVDTYARLSSRPRNAALILATAIRPGTPPEWLVTTVQDLWEFSQLTERDSASVCVLEDNAQRFRVRTLRDRRSPRTGRGRGRLCGGRRGRGQFGRGRLCRGRLCRGRHGRRRRDRDRFGWGRRGRSRLGGRGRYVVRAVAMLIGHVVLDPIAFTCSGSVAAVC